MKTMFLVSALAAAVLLTGCATMVNQTISGGDSGVVAEGSLYGNGTTFSQKTPIPKIEKLPIKIKNWSILSKETRDLIEPYVYTTGNYVQAELKPEFKSIGETKSGFGGGKMVIKNTAVKDLTFMITNWGEDSNILLEIPVHGESTAFQINDVGQYNINTGYVTENIKFAEQNSVADLLTKLDANRAQIEDIAKRYQASKNLY